MLYRGVVAALSTGWRATALPLNEANDEETAPFPSDTRLGEFGEDPIVATEPLTLYRLLLDGTDHAGNVLRAVKRPGLVQLQF